MVNLFRILFNISVSASIFAAAVMIYRLIFKKSPKWISCLLWGLVGLRLVFPFSIESVIGLLPKNNLITDSGSLNTGIQAVDDTVTRVVYNTASAGIQAVQAKSHGLPVQYTIGKIMFYVWLAGVAAMLIASAVSFIKIRLKVLSSVKTDERIFICDDIDTPFILGIFKPEIYIPSGLDENKMQSIIAHEKAHIHRRDNWWKPLGFLILSVYWFNPVLWAAYILLCRDIELACDEKVIKTMTKDEIADYSQTLLDCSKPRRLVTVCPLSFGEVGVKQRIKSALSYKKPALWIIIAALIVSVALSVCFTMKHKSNFAEGTRIVVFENGKYSFYILDKKALKYEKSVELLAQPNSPQEVIDRQMGMSRQAVKWSETVLLAEDGREKTDYGYSENKIYSDIYNALPNKNVARAVAYTNGESYYVSTAIISEEGAEQGASGFLYEYDVSHGNLKPISEIAEGYVIGFYSVMQNEEQDLAAQYKIGNTLWADHIASQLGSYYDGPETGLEFYIAYGGVWRYGNSDYYNTDYYDWTQLGAYDKISLTNANFYNLFRDNPVQGPEKYTNEIKRNNRSAYRIGYNNDMYYFLYQKDASVLLAIIKDYGENPYVSDVVTLVPTKTTFNPPAANWESVIEDAVFTNPPVQYDECILSTVGSIIIGSEEKNGKVKIYALVGCAKYEYQQIDFENMYFVNTGYDFTPAVITYNKNNNTSFINYPGKIDKEKSIFTGVYAVKLKSRIMFPRKIRNSPLYQITPQNTGVILEKCKKTAENYLKRVKNQAIIADYNELPYKYYSSYISGEVAGIIEKIIGKDALYPEFIGSRIIVKDKQETWGYETKFDFDTKRISFYSGLDTFTAMNLDYEFDGNTGEILFNKPSSDVSLIESIDDSDYQSDETSTTALYPATDSIALKSIYIKTLKLKRSQNEKYPQLISIGSAEELEKYIAENKVVYDLTEFKKKTEGYDNDYFNKKSLVLILTREGSGSTYYRNVEINHKNKEIIIKKATPEPCTEDLGYWHIITEVEKNDPVLTNGWNYKISAVNEVFTTTAVVAAETTTTPVPSTKKQSEFNTVMGGIDSFKAKVLEINDSNVLVEPLEGTYERTITNRIYIPNHITDDGPEKKTFPAVSVGDVVEIYYGVGTIDVQKYPAVIDKVYNIKVIYSSTKAETTNKLGYGNKINNDN